MNIRVILFVLILVSLIGFVGQSATVLTTYGERSGFVIVRQFDETVVTVNTPDNRLFQFYGPDVIAITADADILVATGTVLRARPDAEASAVIDLATGTECVVIPTEDNDSPWVQVSVWGDYEGWLPAEVLTDEVVFQPDAWAQRNESSSEESSEN